ncbi:hypothetical protein L208DRAFT_1411854 [Tricholoma matsutake]|nr:hypothetical protein L208DRAFT_1411854 [Tricholoma matsutake 945]
MGVAVKSKRKITHTDPYSGGERSGKKAKPDARSVVAQHTIPRASTTVRPVAPTPTPQGTPAVSPGLTTSVPPATLVPHHVASTPTSTTTTANSHYFNEAAIDLRNTALLRSLLRAQLNRLCKYYGVKAKGTNEDIIHTLSAIVYPLLHRLSAQLYNKL